MKARWLSMSSMVLVVACGGAAKGPVGPPPEYEDPETPVPTPSATGEAPPVASAAAPPEPTAPPVASTPPKASLSADAGAADAGSRSPTID